MKVRTDLIGCFFGRLEVISIAEVKQNGRLVLCKCKCGNFKKILVSSLLSGKSVSCGCFRKERLFKGFKNLSGAKWYKIKKIAARRKIKFNISIQECFNIMERQNYICPGRLLNWGSVETANIDGNCSFDRINSRLDYSKNNCQWVYKPINSIKWDFPEDIFLSYCFIVNKPLSCNDNKVYINNRIFNSWKTSWRQSGDKYFDLDIPYLQSILDNQKGCCALTGIPLKIHNYIDKLRLNTTASVDRIDSNLYHIKNNVQFLHKNINIMKLNHTTEEFKSFCQEVSNYRCWDKNG